MNPTPRGKFRPAARVSEPAWWAVRSVSALFLLLAALTLNAQTNPKGLDFGEAKWPSHPTLLLAKYRGQRLPVIAVEKSQPVVLIDGQRRTISESTPLVTQLAEDYCPAQVEFTGNIGIGKQSWETPLHPASAWIPYSTELREYTGNITLRSTTDVPDAYVLITLFDTGAMDDPTGGDFCKSALIEVGTLHAYEIRMVPLYMKVHMPLRYSNGDPGKKFGASLNDTVVFWQVFSRGLEIRTNNIAEIELRNTHTVYSKDTKSSLEITGIGTFIYLRERAEHADAVEAWEKENRRADCRARPYAMTPLQAGPVEGLPKEASAILSVDEHGKVSQITFSPGFPEAAAKSLTSCLKLWLFLPAIKHGSAVATRIRVPLAF